MSIAIKLLTRFIKGALKDDEEDDDNDNDGGKMFGDSKAQLIRARAESALPDRIKEAAGIDGLSRPTSGGKMSDLSGLEEIGKLFVKRFGKNKGQPRFSGASGKGRHADVEIERDGKLMSGEEIKRSAAVYGAERIDTGRVFQCANGKGSNQGAMMVRKGTEVKLGFGTAVLAALTVAVGNFAQAQPNETFEIQNLYIAHNGDGASAAATIAVHYTLLAHLAVATFKVGDDPLITGANYVPVHGYCGPEELAGYVCSFTDPVNVGVYNGAAFTANLLGGIGGEQVARI